MFAIEAAGSRATITVLVAAIWNLIGWGVTAGIVAESRHNGLSLLESACIAGCSLFVCVGILLAVAAVRAWGERILLAVDGELAAIQTSFLKWRKTKSIRLVASSHARLQRAFESDEESIYDVVIIGDSESLRLPSLLFPEEQDWFIDTFNSKFAPWASGNPPVQAATLRDIAEHGCVVAPLAPRDLPENSRVTIAHVDREQLRFSVQAIPTGLPRLVLTAILSVALLALAVFGEIPSGVRSLVNGAGGIDSLWMLPEFVVWMMIVLALLFLFHGRIETTILPRELKVRWHLGPFGKTFRLATEAVQKVTLGEDARPYSITRHIVTIVARRDILLLTTCHDLQTSQEIAGLVKYQLELVGHTLANE